MKKALAGVLAVALSGLVAGSAMAQVPNVQVYFDANWTQTQTNCPGGVPFAGPPVEIYVVGNNWNMSVTGIDFSIAYPPSLVWLSDNLPDNENLSVLIGQSPTGVAVSWANCCPQDGFLPFLALKPLVLWGECTCGPPQALVVGGYEPLGKFSPTVIRKEDFTEHAGIGMTSLICPGAIATQSSTWGGVKALYR